MQGDGSDIFRFSEFSLDTVEHRLWRGTEEIYLRPRTFETLLYLVQRHGHLVKKEELLNQVWHEVIVTEGTLTHCIEEIRKALNDNAYHPRFLKTIPRVGFKFIARVTVTGAVQPESAAPLKWPAARTSRPIFTSSPPDILPPDRFQQQRVLFRIILTILILILIGVSLALYLRSRGKEIQALAVLPFVNLNADPDQDYFSDGLTEALITSLAKVSDLRIISRTSVMCYKGKNQLLSKIGKELNVEIVVEGSVLYAGKHVRITAQLVTVSPEQHLWAESFEGEIENILMLQNKVVKAITRAISPRINKMTEKTNLNTGLVDPAAFEAYLKGRYFWNKRTADSYQKAIGYFSQAIAQDSGYALAYTGLADCYNLLSDYDFFPPEEMAPKAIALAQKAIQIDPNLGEAYASLGFAKSRFEWDWVGAEQAFLQAIALNKNSAEAHHWYALHLAQRGRFEPALAEIKQAQALDPLSLIVNANVGWMLYFARQTDLALEQLEKAVEMDPNFMSAHIKLGWVYQQKKMHDKAIAEFQTALALSENETAILCLCGEAYALAGDRARAYEIIEHLKIRPEPTYISPYWKALIYVALGATQPALEQLQLAQKLHCFSLVWLQVEPKFDPLRHLPEFQELARQMNFAGTQF